MAVRDKKCKHSKTEDKGLSSLCFIQYFGLISVTFWRKTALLCSPTTAGWDETAHAAGITSSWRFYLFYFFFFQIITLLIQREKLAHQMFAQKYKAGEQQACS